MRIIVNEWLSDTIPLSRGVRQGDSLSPLLYILCVETRAKSEIIQISRAFSFQAHKVCVIKLVFMLMIRPVLLSPIYLRSH